MNFQLKHRGFDCPADLENKITQKMERFERMLPEATYVEVSLLDRTKENNNQVCAEIIVDIPGEKSAVRFHELGESFLEAADKIIDKLDDLLSKRKDKETDHSYNGKPPKEWLADEMNQEEQ